MSVQTITDQEVLHIVHNPGEDKPWEINFDDVSGLKKARAILNYPIHKFETEQKAVEVAEMLRDIIKADSVEINGAYDVRTDEDTASFFEPISSDDMVPPEDTPQWQERPQQFDRPQTMGAATTDGRQPL